MIRIGALAFQEFRGQEQVLLYGGTNPPIRIGEGGQNTSLKIGGHVLQQGGKSSNRGKDLPESGARVLQ